MAFPDTERLSQILAPVLERHGVDLEGIKATPAGKKSQVVVKVDADDRPDLDRLEVISGEISDTFDAAEAAGEVNFGAGYTLEVSTPGVDLPLTAPRHWRRNAGRIAKVRLADDNKAQTFRIGALSPEDNAVILITTKAKVPAVHVVQLANAEDAVVDIEFAQPPAAETEIAVLGFAEAEKLASPAS